MLQINATSVPLLRIGVGESKTIFYFIIEVTDL